MVTLNQITDTMLWILREEGFSSAYPQILMELLANAAQQDILGGRVIHPITGEEAQAWDLHFLNKDVYYSNVMSTYLTADTTIWATTLYAVTTDYPTSWNLYLGQQVVSYTGITWTSFTWVSGILFPYLAGTQVSIAFALPDDFSDVKNVIYNGKFKMPAKQYDDIFESMNDYKGSNVNRNKTSNIYESPYRVAPFYTIKDAAYLIIFQMNTSGESIHLRYECLAPMMTSTWTPVDCFIDNDIYALVTIPYLAVAMMMFERWEEQRGSAVFNNAIKNVKKLYSWYNDTSYESQNWVHYSMQGAKRNI